MKTIRFRSSWSYDAPFIGVDRDCPASEALFKLMRRQNILPVELELVSRMGFKVEITGEMRRTLSELKRNDIPTSVENGAVVPFQGVRID